MGTIWSTLFKQTNLSLQRLHALIYGKTVQSGNMAAWNQHKPKYHLFICYSTTCHSVNLWLLGILPDWGWDLRLCGSAGTSFHEISTFSLFVVLASVSLSSCYFSMWRMTVPRPDWPMQSLGQGKCCPQVACADHTVAMMWALAKLYECMYMKNCACDCFWWC